MGLPIKTERLFIREHLLTDLDKVQIHCSDPEVVKYMPWGPNKIEATRSFIKRIVSCQDQLKRTCYELAVIKQDDDLLIGGVCLYIDSFQDKKAWLGYRLQKEYWGRGYATESAKAIIGYGFQDLKLHRIQAKCDVLNTASAKVLEKCGFTKEGYLREECWQKGRWRDSFLYLILEGEYYK
jgi:ribosomal-protein-alanine N-acetyltransferase